jgi:SAM-dependent methyltransferase
MNEDDRWTPSAELYASLAPQISYYAETARAIVDLAAPRSARVAMSVGCGSSAYLERLLLDRMNRLEVLYCVDISRGMIDTLRARLKDPRVVFLCHSADDLDSSGISDIECAVCSSAIWLFNLDRALPAISRVLTLGGTLTFSIAEWDLADSPARIGSARRYGLIDDELARQGHPPKQSRGSQDKMPRADLYRALLSAGLSRTSEVNGATSMTGRDWRHFYSIPAIAARSIPHVPTQVGLQVLGDAMSRFKADDNADDLHWTIIQCTKDSISRG